MEEVRDSFLSKSTGNVCRDVQSLPGGRSLAGAGGKREVSVHGISGIRGCLWLLAWPLASSSVSCDTEV